MGPYDRRTIVGLRIKKTLSSEHELEASDGSRLTVAQLIGQPANPEFNAMRSGAYTSARHTCSAGMIDSEPGPIEILPFRGEVEVRVHADVLRIAGSYRTGRAIKEGRVKLPLRDIAYARSSGSRIDLWLRAGDGSGALLQRLALDLFSDEAAAELLQWLPDVQPWPHGEALSAPAPSANASISSLLWAAVIGIALVAGLVLWVALRRRF
ncbi:hypothetical protein ACFPOE_18710 [Caenimonas terrae]|uniref:Uncharacterized protein n=1 Tax=Caenimonas terrae TaxID=696074 RepID=A0ABW0NKV7_9BURK